MYGRYPDVNNVSPPFAPPFVSHSASLHSTSPHVGSNILALIDNRRSSGGALKNGAATAAAGVVGVNNGGSNYGSGGGGVGSYGRSRSNSGSSQMNIMFPGTLVVSRF